MINPTVSVIIPVYNRAHLLGQTLRALLAQTRPADEIIVVDDGSTDGSADAARAFGDAVQVLETPNGGPAKARNRGLRVARGKYIQFMDSDDLPTSQFLAARLEAAAASNADMAYGPWMPALIQGEKVMGDGLVWQTAPVVAPMEAFLHGWVLLNQNTMIRRTLLNDVGGYPECLVTGEDMLLLFRMLRHTANLVHTGRSLLLVRQHPEGQISASPALASRRVIDELVMTTAVLAELNDGAPHQVTPSRAAVRAWARRRARAFAHAQLAGVTPPLDAGASPSLITAASATIEGLVERLATRVRYQRVGYRIAPFYHPAPIGAQHTAGIRELRLEMRLSRDSLNAGCEKSSFGRSTSET